MAQKQLAEAKQLLVAKERERGRRRLPLSSSLLRSVLTLHLSCTHTFLLLLAKFVKSTLEKVLNV